MHVASHGLHALAAAQASYCCYVEGGAAVVALTSLQSTPPYCAHV